jgi:hypothetical protein
VDVNLGTWPRFVTGEVGRESVWWFNFRRCMPETRRVMLMMRMIVIYRGRYA